MKKIVKTHILTLFHRSEWLDCVLNTYRCAFRFPQKTRELNFQANLDRRVYENNVDRCSALLQCPLRSSFLAFFELVIFHPPETRHSDTIYFSISIVSCFHLRCSVQVIVQTISALFVHSVFCLCSFNTQWDHFDRPIHTLSSFRKSFPRATKEPLSLLDLSLSSWVCSHPSIFLLPLLYTSEQVTGFLTVSHSKRVSISAVLLAKSSNSFLFSCPLDIMHWLLFHKPSFIQPLNSL